jgi:hypothetical protein
MNTITISVVDEACIKGKKVIIDYAELKELMDAHHDMYEALEELIKRFRRDTTDKYMGAPQIVLDAETALAKARGEK